MAIYPMPRRAKGAIFCVLARAELKKLKEQNTFPLTAVLTDWNGHGFEVTNYFE